MNPDETPEYYPTVVDDKDSNQVSSDEDHASGFHCLPDGISPLPENATSYGSNVWSLFL
jgi:hypothetical protein